MLPAACSDHVVVDHGVVVGPERTKSIAGRGIGGAISASARWSPASLLQKYWWGAAFFFPLPLAVSALLLACVSCRARERGDRTASTIRRHALGVARRARSCWRSTSRRCPTRARWCYRRGSRAAAALRSSSASGARANPLYDLDVAGRRSSGSRPRRHHRVRLADGRDVHRPAVPAERARVLDARRRGSRSCRPPC